MTRLQSTPLNAWKITIRVMHLLGNRIPVRSFVSTWLTLFGGHPMLLRTCLLGRKIEQIRLPLMLLWSFPESVIMLSGLLVPKLLETVTMCTPLGMCVGVCGTKARLKGLIGAAVR